MIVSCREMMEAEEKAFTRGISAADLMEEVGESMAAVVTQFFPEPGHLICYLGKGNNAGDALVLARELLSIGWKVSARLAFREEDFKSLPAGHWEVLAGQIQVWEQKPATDPLKGQVVLIDGLLGIGARGGLDARCTYLTQEMNSLRKCRHAVTIALDIPSGLNAETGEPDEKGVQADFTLTVGYVKSCLLEDSATNHVGRLVVIPLPDVKVTKGDTSREALTAKTLLPTLPRRSAEYHKGDAGRVGILAGSESMPGAAALASLGALRGGAGLVTLYVREAAHGVVAPKVPPEVMVKPVRDYTECLDARHDVLAIGPGLGIQEARGIATVISTFGGPMVLDADALNIFAVQQAQHPAWRNLPLLLTPHPGEMKRIAESLGYAENLTRLELSQRFIEDFPQSTLLLKGARTLVATRGRASSYNTTGTPGMATGGFGDVLTGLCAALLAQGVGRHHAACLGAWLSGRAAEIALSGSGQSQESLAAGDAAQLLGAAFSSLKALDH